MTLDGISELLALHLQPVIERLDRLKLRLDLGGASAGSPEVAATLSELTEALRKEFAEAITRARREIESALHRQVFERTANFAHTSEVSDLKERIARLEMMLLRRWITPEFESRLRAEHADVDWDAAMRLFDRWLVHEKPPHVDVRQASSRIIRKFLKLWRQGFFRDGFRPGMPTGVVEVDDTE